MKIETALDWNNTSILLKKQLTQIGYNPDLLRMFANINNMVTELSKLEVTVRRIRRYELLNDKVSEINNSISHLEKLILIAALMK